MTVATEVLSVAVLLFDAETVVVDADDGLSNAVTGLLIVSHALAAFLIARPIFRRPPLVCSKSCALDSKWLVLVSSRQAIVPIARRENRLGESLLCTDKFGDWGEAWK